jgi:tetratricopeptide (TPR) repeat protein
VGKRALLCVILWSAALFGQAPDSDFGLAELLARYQTTPQDALLCEQIGVAYTRLSDLAKAESFFRKAVQLNSQRVSSRKNLATVLWFQGKKKESETIFRSLETSIPADPVPQLYLGLAEYDRKDMASAAAHFEQAGSFASENPEIFLSVVDSYLSTGRFEQAAGILERVVSSGRADAPIYRLLGDAYDGEQKPEKAYSAYSQAIEQQPGSEDGYLALAGFAVEHANLSIARDVLNRGLQQISGSAKLRLALGLAWALEGDYEKSQQTFLAAAEADQRWFMPWMALGVADLQTGKPESAASDFRKAKALAPEDYRCYYLRAMALTRSSQSQDPGVRTEAASDLRHAIALDPHQAKPRALLATLEISSGQLALAERELREALRVEPNEPSALYRLALLCRREGKTQECERLMIAFRKVKGKAENEENAYVLIMRTVK